MFRFQNNVARSTLDSRRGSITVPLLTRASRFEVPQRCQIWPTAKLARITLHVFCRFWSLSFHVLHYAVAALRDAGPLSARRTRLLTLASYSQLREFDLTLFPD